MEKVNVCQKFSLFSQAWSPKIVGELNGQHVKLAKLKGEFVWHQHAGEDELFYVVKGTLTVEMRDQIITVSEGEFVIVPKGIEHKPSAKDEAWVMLFEPAATRNTGDIDNDWTVAHLDWI